MDIKEEAYVLCSMFGVMIITLIVLCCWLLKNLTKAILKFTFCMCLMMQVILRCSFLVIAIFLDQRRLGNFYNNFPAAVFVSICTALLLEWVKVSTESFAYSLAFYLIVNSLMYTSIFIVFGLEVSLSPQHITYYFSIIFCFMWFTLIAGIAYFLIKTYPWKDITQEWTDHKIPIVAGLITMCMCLLIRTLLLILGAFFYENTFNFYDPSDSNSTPKIPTPLLFAYYAIGEFLPAAAMLLVQFKLPYDLTKKPYGELERLIKKMKDEPVDYKSDSMLCKICLEKEINTAFLPCRHSTICEDCSILVDICPLCRKQITQTLLIYRS